MKKNLLVLYFFLISISIVAQNPNAFSYQAVARGSNGDLLANQAVSFRISILQGATSGTAVYTETHAETTNTYGLVTFQIGNGTTSNSFSAINWANGPYFLKVEIDATGGTTYVFMGTSQLLSVPYAKYAELSGNASLPQYTQAQIDALTPTAGMLVFNTDYKVLQFFDGIQWTASSAESECVPQPNYPYFINDGEINSTTFTVAVKGNEPSFGIKGFWNIESNNGGSFADRTNPETTFTGVNDSLYYISWNLYSNCDTATTYSQWVYMSNTVRSINFNGTLYVYPVDNSTGISWSNGEFITTNATSETNGANNTDSIVTYQGTGNYAAYLCDTLTAFGHDDWYLPAKDELNALYLNKELIHGWGSAYWSSTEYDSNSAFLHYFFDGTQTYCGKNDRAGRVRCVRRD